MMNAITKWRINRALNKEFGKGVVSVGNGFDGYPVSLHFEKSGPDAETVEKAKEIFDNFVPMEWFDDKMRTTPPGNGR